MTLQLRILPKKAYAQLWDVDAFCGPCFHRAMNHNGFASTAPLCWECPGAKSDYNTHPPAWWDRPEGDPSLENFSCPECNPQKG